MKRIKKLFFTFVISLSLMVMAPISVAEFQPVFTIEVQAKSTTVYITPTGKKYHKRKCGNGSYSKATLTKAKNLGLSPCKKCY